MGLLDHDCHPELPRDNEFHGLGLGGGAVSYEEALFIASVCYIQKPDIFIELGTAQGGSSVAIAAALKDLGKGQMLTADLALNPPQKAVEIKNKYDLPLQFINKCHSIDLLKAYTVEQNKRYVVFSDTDIPVRPLEVELVLAKFPKDTLVIVHDTSDIHPFGPMELKKKTRSIQGVNIVELPSPRGISLLKVMK